jgi:[ribosomal protein S5]-alanine N-acetyltransferase
MSESVFTEHINLIPTTVDLARAELADHDQFSRLLGAAVPDNWPPASIVDTLPLFLRWLEAAPDRVGWYGWYALIRDDDESHLVLAGNGGFMGPPDAGVIQIGYSVLPQFQRRGYATEMVRGLVRWAFGQQGVDVIVAETEWANPASVRIMEKVGFAAVGPTAEPRGIRFELRAVLQ